MTTSKQERRIPFASMARTYLDTLDTYREAKTAVEVARRIGRCGRDLEHHAAERHARHLEAFEALVSCAVSLRAAEGQQ